MTNQQTTQQESVLDDPVVAGVLTTISDRGEGDYDDVAAWVAEIGSDRFYEILRDHTGDVSEYFTTQAEAGASFDAQEFASTIPFDTSDPDDEGCDIDFLWEQCVGPAVDRVSDAYAAARDITASA